MKTWFENNWKRLAESDSGVGLALFRIHFAVTVLFEVIQLWCFRRLLFTDTPMGHWLSFDPSLLLLLWMVVLGCVIAGWQTRVAVVLNWALTMWWSFNTTRFEYHADYFVWGAATLLLFVPGNLPLSLDTWLRRRAGKPLVPSVMRARAYRAALVFFGVALVYFDSVFWKFGDEMWLKGLGFWYPASLPQVSWVDLSPVLGIEWLARGSGYLVLYFEAVFLFLLPFRRMRWPLLITGVALHVGIMVAFPIPLFGFGVLAVYWLLVPDEFYLRLFNNLPEAPEAPLPSRQTTRLAMTVLMAVGLVLQMPFSLQGPPLSRNLVASILGKKKARRLLNAMTDFVTTVQPVTARLLGITTHCVFTYELQMKDYNNLLAMREAGTDRWLPLVYPNGHVNPACNGRVWVYYGFRVNSRTPSLAAMEKGYGRMAELDCLDRGKAPADVRYEILYQPHALPLEWMSQEQKPQVRTDQWQTAFDLAWNGTKFVLTPRTTPAIVPHLGP